MKAIITLLIAGILGIALVLMGTVLVKLGILKEYKKDLETIKRKINSLRHK